VGSEGNIVDRGHSNFCSSSGRRFHQEYLKRVTPRVLESQCIPMDKNLWVIEQAAEFWSARRSLLAESFNSFLKDALPQRRL